MEGLKKAIQKINFRTRNSRKVYIPIYLMIIILLGLITYIKITNKPDNPNAVYSAVLFSFLLILGTEIHRLGNLYEITATALIHKKGYFTTIAKRIEFGAISDIDIRQNIWQKIFGFGNVLIYKFSEESSLKNIDNPSLFVEYLDRNMEGRRR